MKDIRTFRSPVDGLTDSTASRAIFGHGAFDPEMSEPELRGINAAACIRVTDRPAHVSINLHRSAWRVFAISLREARRPN